VDLYQKIALVGPSAKYDTCGPRDLGNSTNIPGVYHAKVNGGICRLFKVLQTNACKNNCYYCVLRRDRECQRTFVSPDEMAKAFDLVYNRRLVDGLFLSSGLINSPQITMSHMLDTVNILRRKYHYHGYVHLKLMPGTPQDCIREAMRVSNRISLNIESPSEQDLTKLAPDKNLKNGFFDTLIKVKAEEKRRKYYGKKTPSITTQFVVGAIEENDEAFVKVTHMLYKVFGLWRVFYSPFRPVPNTPLENRPDESITRVHRLYQADFLLRFYRFGPRDIPFDNSGCLSENEDPKLAWAKKNPETFPININHADYWNLLKIPGIGPASAKKILTIRTEGKINSLEVLRGQRFLLKKMDPYVCV